MSDKLFSIKAAIAAFFTAASAFLGWQGVMFFIWLAAMALDYLSGSAAAWLSGQWSSKVAREGLKHKGGMILVVAVAGLADITFYIICAFLPVDMTWPVLVAPLVMGWYILTELGSILENAVKMGAPLPGWLMKLLKMGLAAIDHGMGEQVEDAEETVGEEYPIEEDVSRR